MQTYPLVVFILKTRSFPTPSLFWSFWLPISLKQIQPFKVLITENLISLPPRLSLKDHTWSSVFFFKGNSVRRMAKLLLLILQPCHWPCRYWLFTPSQQKSWSELIQPHTEKNTEARGDIWTIITIYISCRHSCHNLFILTGPSTQCRDL